MSPAAPFLLVIAVLFAGAALGLLFAQLVIAANLADAIADLGELTGVAGAEAAWLSDWIDARASGTPTEAAVRSDPHAGRHGRRRGDDECRAIFPASLPPGTTWAEALGVDEGPAFYAPPADELDR